VGDGLRADVLNAFCHGIERDHSAAGPFQIDLRQHVGEVLELRHDFKHHAVLIGGRVDGGGPALAVAAVEALLDLLRIQAVNSGFVAIDFDADSWSAHLRVAVDVEDGRELGDFFFECGGFAIERGGVGALQRQFVRAAGASAADANGGRKAEGGADAGNGSYFRTEAGNDLLCGGGPWEEGAEVG